MRGCQQNGQPKLWVTYRERQNQSDAEIKNNLNRVKSEFREMRVVIGSVGTEEEFESKGRVEM